MEYKLVSPLKTRHVEPWEAYINENKIFERGPIGLYATVIRKAVEHGWFEGEKPNADEMPADEVVKLGTAILEAYNHALRGDLPNSPARSQITSKE